MKVPEKLESAWQVPSWAVLLHGICQYQEHKCNCFVVAL